MPFGWAMGVKMGNSVATPLVVMRPIWLAPSSVNHRAPSGPAQMLVTTAWGVGSGYSVKAPDVVIRPSGGSRLAVVVASTIQKAPSGPRVKERGVTLAGRGNSVMLPLVVMRPILLAVGSVNQ